MPLLIEIIGPAGAGKSSLLRELGRSQPDLAIFADRLPIRKIRNLPFYVGSGLTALPTLFSSPWQGKWYTKEEISRILYLIGMPQIFQQRHRNNRILVIDQGPIFELTHLHEFGPKRVRRPTLAHWWSQLFQRWAQMTVLVVWLDAPDDVLIPRVRARDQAHTIKGCSDAEARTLLARYRASFAVVMAQLQRYAPIQVLTFHTDDDSLEQIAQQILQEIEQIDYVNSFEKSAYRSPMG